MKTTNRFAYLVTAVTTAFVFCMFVTACGSDDKSELEDLEEDMNDGVTVTKGLHVDRVKKDRQIPIRRVAIK